MCPGKSVCDFCFLPECGASPHRVPNSGSQWPHAMMQHPAVSNGGWNPASGAGWAGQSQAECGDDSKVCCNPYGKGPVSDLSRVRSISLHMDCLEIRLLPGRTRKALPWGTADQPIHRQRYLWKKFAETWPIGKITFLYCLWQAAITYFWSKLYCLFISSINIYFLILNDSLNTFLLIFHYIFGTLYELFSFV